MLRGGLKSSFSMRAYLSPSVGAAPAVTAELARLAALRPLPDQDSGLAAALRLAALLAAVDTRGVAPLVLFAERGVSSRSPAPFEPWRALAPGQYIVLPPVKNNATSRE